MRRNTNACRRRSLSALAGLSTPPAGRAPPTIMWCIAPICTLVVHLADPRPKRGSRGLLPVGSLPAADLGEHFPGCHLGANPELDGAPQGASLTAAAQRSMSCRCDQARASRRVPWR